MQIKERRVADWCRREHEKYEGNRNKNQRYLCRGIVGVW